MNQKYKKTEIGVIPEDWELSTLKDAFPRLDAGVSVNSDTESLSDYYVLKTSAVRNGTVYLQEAKPVIPADYQRLKCPVKKGSIIISRMNTPLMVGECGYVHEANENTYLPDRLWQIENPVDSDYSFEWLNYLLNTSQYKAAIRSTATGTSNSMKNIAKDRLLEITIPKPALPEQELIAEALSDIDELIFTLEKLIAKKKTIKQGAMQQLLTGKTRLSNQSSNWREERLGDVVLTSSGGTPSREIEEYYRGTIPWITTSELNDRYLYDSIEHITDEAVRNSSAKKFPRGTVLMAMYGATIGKLGILETDSTTNQACCAMMCTTEVNNLYLFYYLLFNREEIVSLGSGAGQPNISQTIVKNLTIKLPDYDEQMAIGKLLNDMDMEIQELEARVWKQRQLKQGMMPQLLTGKTRLNY